MESKETIVFISGSREIDHLDQNVLTFINEAMIKNHRIIIGDCDGVDTLVQEYLYRMHYSNVTIYASGKCPRNFKGNILWAKKCLGLNIDEYESPRDYYAVKDVMMTNDCTYGICIWNGTSRASKANIERLKGMGKECFIFNIK